MIILSSLLLSALSVVAEDEMYELSDRVRTVEWEHFQMLNRLRAKGFTCPHGTVYEPNNKPLVFDCRLWKTAQLYSQEMGEHDFFGHTGHDGSTFVQRALRQDIRATGENLSAGYEDPYRALMGLKFSDAHCVNLGRTEFGLFAIGRVDTKKTKYINYWTQLFASPLKEGEPDKSCYPEDTSPTIEPTPVFQGLWGADDSPKPITKDSVATRDPKWDPTKCQIIRDGEQKCSHCFTTPQCQEAYDQDWFCCPYLKKCIRSKGGGGYNGCGGRPADCPYNCDDNKPFECTCYNQDFPRNWMRGCQDPTLTPAPTTDEGLIRNEHKCWNLKNDNEKCVKEKAVSVVAMDRKTCLNHYYNYQCTYVKFNNFRCFCAQECGEWKVYDRKNTEQEAMVYVNRHAEYFLPGKVGEGENDCAETDNGDPQTLEVTGTILRETKNPTVMPLSAPKEGDKWDPRTCPIFRDDWNCAPCVTTDQCRVAYGTYGGTGREWYCDEKVKRCMIRGAEDMKCGGAQDVGVSNADCKRGCTDDKDPMECDCKNDNFPRKWIKGCYDPQLEFEYEKDENGFLVGPGQCWEVKKVGQDTMKCVGGSYASVSNGFPKPADCANEFLNNQCDVVIHNGSEGCSCKRGCRWVRFGDWDYRYNRKYFAKCVLKDAEGLPIIENVREETFTSVGNGQCVGAKRLRAYVRKSRVQQCSYECEISPSCTHYVTDVNTREPKFGNRGLSCWLYDGKGEELRGDKGTRKHYNNFVCYRRDSLFEANERQNFVIEENPIIIRSEPLDFNNIDIPRPKPKDESESKDDYKASCTNPHTGRPKGKTVKHEGIEDLCQCQLKCEDEKAKVATFTPKRNKCYCIEKPKKERRKLKLIAKNADHYQYLKLQVEDEEE